MSIFNSSFAQPQLPVVRPAVAAAPVAVAPAPAPVGAPTMNRPASGNSLPYAAAATLAVRAELKQEIEPVARGLMKVADFARGKYDGDRKKARTLSTGAIVGGTALALFAPGLAVFGAAAVGLGALGLFLFRNK